MLQSGNKGQTAEERLRLEGDLLVLQSVISVGRSVVMVETSAHGRTGEALKPSSRLSSGRPTNAAFQLPASSRISGGTDPGELAQ